MHISLLHTANSLRVEWGEVTPDKSTGQS